AGAEVVFRMNVGGDKVEAGTLAHLVHFAHHGLAVLRAHAGIHDESAASADDDRDIGHEHDVKVGNDIDVLGDLLSDAFLDHRWRQRLPTLRTRAGPCGHDAGRD